MLDYVQVINIPIMRGDTRRRPLRFSNIDLTGYTLKLQARVDPDDKKALLTLTEGAGIEFVLDGADSVLMLNFAHDPVAAAKLPANESLVYDLQGTIGNEITTFIMGTLDVTGDVTK